MTNHKISTAFDKNMRMNLIYMKSFQHSVSFCLPGVRFKGNSSMHPISEGPKYFSLINCCRTTLNLLDLSSKCSGNFAPIE